MMTDNEMYFASNTVGANGVVDLTTGVRRSLNPYPSDPFKVISERRLHVHAPGFDRADKQGLAHGALVRR